MSISSRRLFDGAAEELGILPVEASGEAFTGTVSGSTTTAGTVVGGIGYPGTVTGATTTSGAVYGRKHPRDHIGELGTAPLGIVRIGGIEDPYTPPIAFNGTVTGTTTTSGTVIGSEGAFGVVTGSTTTSGSVVGSGGNVTVDTQPAIGFDPPRPRRQEPPQRIRRRGVVAGHTTTFGAAFGTGRAADDEQELVLLGLI